MTMTARTVAAQQIARKAGDLAHDFFVQRASLAIEEKGSQDFVTRADRAVEALIAGELAAAFPGDAFLGEESLAKFSATPDSVWVVDPIDGTHNFLRGVRYYCVSIAYVANGRCEIGVIYDPEHDEVFHARRGHGAWCQRAGDDVPLRTNACDSLAKAFVALGHHDRFPEPRYMALRQALMDAGTAVRNMGAGALQLAHVAAGRYDGFIELSLSAWDALAGLLLVEEAGGHVAPARWPKSLTQTAPVLGCTKGIAREIEKAMEV
jgi:myo-inositol-1(or 4)-monophosphatase